MNSDILQLREDMATLKSDAATPFFKCNKVPAISAVAHESNTSSQSDIPEPAEPKTFQNTLGETESVFIQQSDKK